MTNAEFESSGLYEGYSGNAGTLPDSGTSIFDPCLCEMNYSWFTRRGDRILDPFAGGSVRGIVASVMGRSYTGIELRNEQVDENRKQAAAICGSDAPVWINGDSCDMDSLLPEGKRFDFLFTCPPYGDLEVYSDDERDISGMSSEEFDAAYSKIISLAAERLENDRFATIVVGNYRDKKGCLRDLCGLTVKACEAAGLRYYNDMILVTPAGSLPIRVGKQFSASRKVGRTHQYVLNFVKGDPKAAAQRIGDVEIAQLEE